VTLILEQVGSIIQMVRFGFGRIDSKEVSLIVYFAHKSFRTTVPMDSEGLIGGEKIGKTVLPSPLMK
jgi:hypothetical protein